MIDMRYGGARVICNAKKVAVCREIDLVVSCHFLHIGIFAFGRTWALGMFGEQNFSTIL